MLTPLKTSENQRFPDVFRTINWELWEIKGQQCTNQSCIEDIL